MISCQPPLITLRLYLSLVCSPNLFLSLLTQLPPLSPENFFFSNPPPPRPPSYPLTHPTFLPFPCPVLLCSLWTPDEGRGFLMRAYQSLQPRDHIGHMCFTILPLKPSRGFSGLRSWWLRRFIALSLRRKWMLHLCHFNGSLIMSGRIARSTRYQNKTWWCLVWKGRQSLAVIPFFRCIM